MKDSIIKYCSKCKKETPHIRYVKKTNIGEHIHTRCKSKRNNKICNNVRG